LTGSGQLGDGGEKLAGIGVIGSLEDAHECNLVKLSLDKRMRESYKFFKMKKLACPKCGMVTMGGSGFWGTSKPYCSFCGWNLQAAKELERASLKQLPKSLLFLAWRTPAHRTDLVGHGSNDNSQRLAGPQANG
jgi:hypothetical protein